MGFSILSGLYRSLPDSGAYQCNRALHTLIRLLRSLGFCAGWHKVMGPTQKIIFLGIDINTVDSTMSLGGDKLRKFDDTLNNFWARTRAMKQQLQSLAGLLKWACNTVQAGKFFLRHILDSIAHLKHPWHKIKLSQNFKHDVAWWKTYITCV